MEDIKIENHKIENINEEDVPKIIGEQLTEIKK